MKNILIYITLIQIITLNTYAAEIEDCSIYSKLNPKYLACKTANFAKNATNYQKKTWSKEKDKMKKLKEKVLNK